jgi:hypothetical protein
MHHSARAASVFCVVTTLHNLRVHVSPGIYSVLRAANAGFKGRKKEEKKKLACMLQASPTTRRQRWQQARAEHHGGLM